MAATSTRYFTKGELIFSEGDPADCMYILVSGEVELSKPGERGAVMLKTVANPNEFFGEMALIDGKPRSATARAVKDSSLMVVDAAAFEQLLRTNGQFAVKIIAALSARIRGANLQIVDLVDTDPKDRLLRGIADFAFQFGSTASGDARYVEHGALREWLNGHTGASFPSIDAVIARLVEYRELSPLREEGEAEGQGYGRLVVSGSFMRRFNRRHPSRRAKV